MQRKRGTDMKYYFNSLNTDTLLCESIGEILNSGYKDVNPRPKYKDGTPAHTLSVNHQIRKYDLSNGDFPLCSLRKQAWKSAIKEILWIYQDASNNLDILRNRYSVNYWDEWESKDRPNTIGQRYGATVNKYNLMERLLYGLKENPYGRRHVMSLWQEEDFSETDGLFPCAFCTIWNVRKGRDDKEYLDMALIQRSGDLLTASGAGGVNEIQYATLLILVARHCGYEAGVFTHFVANEQIYDRHIEQARELINRRMSYCYRKKFVQPPDNNKTYERYLEISDRTTNFYEVTIDDFNLVGYEPMTPQLKLDLGI